MTISLRMSKRMMSMHKLLAPHSLRTHIGTHVYDNWRQAARTKMRTPSTDTTPMTTYASALLA
jgi:hypothetical protein